MTVEKTIQDFLKDSNGLKNIRMSTINPNS